MCVYSSLNSRHFTSIFDVHLEDRISSRAYRSRSASWMTGVHAVPPEYGRGRGRRQKRLQCLGGLCIRTGRDTTGVNCDVLDFCRQRTQKIDARFVDQLAYLLETEFGFAVRKILGNAHARCRLFRLVLHLVRYPKAVEQALDIDAT